MSDISCHVISDGSCFFLSLHSEEQEEEVGPPPADTAFLMRPRPRPTAQPESGIKRLYVSD